MKCLKCPKCGGVADIDRDGGWWSLRILCRFSGHDQFIAGPGDPRPFRLIPEGRASELETLPAEVGEGLKGMAIVSALRKVVGYRFPVSMANVVQPVDASARWMLKKPQGKRRRPVLALMVAGWSEVKGQRLPSTSEAASKNIAGGS